LVEHSLGKGEVMGSSPIVGLVVLKNTLYKLSDDGLFS
jgi:hypothetical protein